MVRTATRVLDGKQCDPDVRHLSFPDLGQTGIVDARCSSVSIEQHAHLAVPTVGTVRVTIGPHTFNRCALNTQQRDHNPDGIYTAWGYSCADENTARK